jgi:phosphoglycerate dehydrogenase-like enzyme
MNKREKPLLAVAPFPQKYRRIFFGETERRLRDLVQILHLGDDKAIDEEALDRALPEAVALVGQVPMPKERLDRAVNLRAIFNVEGNFYQNIDYSTCFDRGIHVLNCGGAYAVPVAEMALGMAIDLARGISEADRRFRAGNEIYLGASCLDSVLLSGSDVGLIGFGNLGRALLNLLNPFRCEVRIYDPWIPENVIREGQAEPTGLEDLLRKSLFIFVLAGVTQENQGFLSREKIGLIRKGAFFLLISRAAVIDFDALLDAVEEGAFNAAVDVFPEEPMPKNHRVRSMEKLLLSPHRAGGIPQAFQRIGEMVVDDLDLIIRGLPPHRMQAAQRETVTRFASRPAR